MKLYSVAIGAAVIGLSSTAFADPPLASPGPAWAQKKPHSVGLMAGGGVLVGLGGISIVTGTTIAVIDLFDRHTQGLGALIIGLPLFLHGVGCIGGGTAMIYIGARRIPVTSASLSESL